MLYHEYGKISLILINADNPKPASITHHVALAYPFPLTLHHNHKESFLIRPLRLNMNTFILNQVYPSLALTITKDYQKHKSAKKW